MTNNTVPEVHPVGSEPVPSAYTPQTSGGEESMYSWERMAAYALLGAVAAAALATTFRPKEPGPKNLLDGALAALQAGADSTYSSTQTDLLMLFGPAVIAAGAVMAAQLARLASRAQRA